MRPSANSEYLLMGKDIYQKQTTRRRGGRRGGRGEGGGGGRGGGRRGKRRRRRRKGRELREGGAGDPLHVDST